MRDRLLLRAACCGYTAPICGAAVFATCGSPTFESYGEEDGAELLRVSKGSGFDPPRTSVGIIDCEPPSGAGGGFVGVARIVVGILTGSV
jgi:hypothetical protein